MLRYLKIYKKFLNQYIKTLVEYKEDFIYGILAFFLIQASSIIFINIIFTNIPSLDGWSFYEILFIYGFSQIPRGIDHVFTDYLWIFSGNSIRNGDFDRYLLRPLNPLFQVISQRFQPDGFGEIVIGFILMLYSFKHLSIKYSSIFILSFIISILGGTLIYTSIKLATASISFWTKTSFRHMQIGYGLSDFSKYPVSIYPSGIKNILTYIIPFAFTGFYPASYFLGKVNFVDGILKTLIIGVVSIFISYYIWKKGIASYESAGN